MRIFTLISGSILLLLGLVSMVTPIPGGTLFIVVGGGMIICSSEKAEKYIRGKRLKHAGLNERMIWIEDKMGQRISAPLRRTRPEKEASL